MLSKGFYYSASIKIYRFRLKTNAARAQVGKIKEQSRLGLRN